MKVSNSFSIWISFIILCLFSTILVVAQKNGTKHFDENIKGQNVGLVVEQAESGEKYDWLQSGKRWMRMKQRSDYYTVYVESNRDEWSVYMSSSEGQKIQLNLWDKKVYDLTNKKETNIVQVGLGDNDKKNPFTTATKGGNVVYVDYDQKGSEGKGYFKQVSKNRWEEHKEGKKEVHDFFTEDMRDEWSVYLINADGIKVQLDLYTKKVLVNGQDYYEISQAKSYTNGCNVSYINYKEGRLKQINFKEWEEYPMSSDKPKARYTEYARDEWSVYLIEENGEKSRLDIHTKEILKNEKVEHEITTARATPIPSCD